MVVTIFIIPINCNVPNDVDYNNLFKMKEKLLKYRTDWKAIYIIWILSSIFINKPLPYHFEYLLKQYEILLWGIGAFITSIAIYHITKKNWMQSLLLLLLFLVPKLLVIIGNNVSSFIFQFLDI
ncbi:MAG TPA: hypothetical protein DEB74_17985 [Lachnospiraceae bacterium]|nr:hypothetical protein [Lachnospiraceae bacterium]